jgi:SAM-dependent methyltransferase
VIPRFLRQKNASISMGDLRRYEPVSRVFGTDRGTTIRRAYIEEFLENYRAGLRGRIMEVGDDRYARRFGAADATIEVLDPDRNNPAATIHGNLQDGDGVPESRYDAIILTQVLHVLPDMGAALRIVHRALKPGGVLLATLPGISQVSRYDMDRWGDYWRVTDRAAALLLRQNFPSEQSETQVFGNHLSAIAALTGLAAEELSAEELRRKDPDYQVLIGIWAKKGNPA